MSKTLVAHALAERVSDGDVLGLGSESRMNTPGTASGNWVWRLLPGQADAQTAARLLARTQAACRI